MIPTCKCIRNTCTVQGCRGRLLGNVKQFQTKHVTLASGQKTRRKVDNNNPGYENSSVLTPRTSQRKRRKVDNNTPGAENSSVLTPGTSQRKRRKVDNNTPVYLLPDFENVLKRGTFVDKTIFLEQIRLNFISVIIRPRNFGKTLIASMITYFYSLEVDEDGNVIPISNERRLLFQNTLISEKKEVMNEMGKYPVINLNFSMEAKDAKDVHCGILDTMKAAYQKFDYLNLPEPEKSDLGTLLSVLIETLYDKYSELVIIVVDEFDCVLHRLLTAYKRSISTEREEIKNVAKIYYQLLVSASSSKYVKFITFFGALMLDYSALFKDTHKIFFTFSTIYNPLGFTLGFTEQDVRKYFPEIINQNKLDELREWYGSYSIEPEVFSPLSVLCYIQEGFVTGSYTDSVGGTSYLPEYISIDAIVCKLRQIILSRGILSGCTRKPTVISKRVREIKTPDVIGLLAQNGIITPERKIENWNNIINFRLTNFECENILKSKIEADCSHVRNFEFSPYKIDIMNSIINFNFLDSFSTNLKLHISSLKKPDKKDESYYHGVMGTILDEIMKQSTYQFIYGSDEKGGVGKYDNMILSINQKESRAALFEYSVVDEASAFPKMVIEKLKQVNNRSYISCFNQYKHIETVYVVIIIFLRAGNNLAVDVTKYPRKKDGFC